MDPPISCPRGQAGGNFGQLRRLHVYGIGLYVEKVEQAIVCDETLSYGPDTVAPSSFNFQNRNIAQYDFREHLIYHVAGIDTGRQCHTDIVHRYLLRQAFAGEQPIFTMPVHQFALTLFYFFECSITTFFLRSHKFGLV